MTWQHSLHSEQENQDPSWFAAGKLPPFYESEDAAGSLTQAPFQFHAHRSRIDWRVLHGVDVDEVVRRTDIDTLERCVNAIAFGDIEAEGPGSLTRVNFIRIFRLSQLTVEYLLHVQDRLASEAVRLRDERNRACKHVELLRMGVKEGRDKQTAAQKDIKQLKKTLKMLQRLAPQTGAATSTQDAAAGARLQAQLERLQEERQSLRDDMKQLRLALQHSQEQGAREKEAAVMAARIQERDAAAERVAAAVEQERARHQDRFDTKGLQDEIKALKRAVAASQVRARARVSDDSGSESEEDAGYKQKRRPLTQDIDRLDARATAMQGRIQAQELELKEVRRMSQSQSDRATTHASAPARSQGQQPGTTTAELRATLAELARQAEETQLLRTELARAKQSSRPDDATTTHAANFQPKVTRVSTQPEPAKVERLAPTRSAEVPAQPLSPDAASSSDGEDDKAAERAELKATLEQGRQQYTQQHPTASHSPNRLQAAMHPGTAASPASPLGILQQAQALNQQMSTAAAAQQPAPPDSPEFPRPGQARGDMSPRKRRSWLAKLAFLKKRRMRQQDASPERSAGGYTSTLGSPLSDSGHIPATQGSYFDNTYGANFSPLRSGIDPLSPQQSLQEASYARSPLRPRTAPGQSINPYMGLTHPFNPAALRPAQARSPLGLTHSQALSDHQNTLSRLSPFRARSMGGTPSRFAPRTQVHALDSTGQLGGRRPGMLREADLGRSMSHAASMPMDSIRSPLSRPLSPADRPGSALQGWASSLQVPTSPTDSLPHTPPSPILPFSLPASPRSPRRTSPAAVQPAPVQQQPAAPYRSIRTQGQPGSMTSTGISFRDSPRAKESGLGASGTRTIRPVRARARAFNFSQ